MLRTTKTIGFVLWAASTLCSASGFYVGAGFGPQLNEFREDATIIQLGSFYAKNHDYKSGRGMFGSLFGGYEHYFATTYMDCISLYLAGEINGNINSAEFEGYNKESIHRTFSNTEFRVQRSYGLSLLPGVLLTDTTLLYGRIGFSRGYFKAATTDISLQNIHESVNGLRYGVGLKHELTQHLSLRMEYSDVAYKHVNMFTLDLNSLTSKNTGITPQTALVEFGLLYHFS